MANRGWQSALEDVPPIEHRPEEARDVHPVGQSGGASPFEFLTREGGKVRLQLIKSSTNHCPSGSIHEALATTKGEQYAGSAKIPAATDHQQIRGAAEAPGCRFEAQGERLDVRYPPGVPCEPTFAS